MSSRVLNPTKNCCSGESYSGKSQHGKCSGQLSRRFAHPEYFLLESLLMYKFVIIVIIIVLVFNFYNPGSIDPSS